MQFSDSIRKLLKKRYLFKCRYRKNIMVGNFENIEQDYPGTFFRLEKQDYEDLLYFSGMKGSAIAKQLCKYFLELCRKNEILKKEIRDLQIKDLEKRINKIQYLNSRHKIRPLIIKKINPVLIPTARFTTIKKIKNAKEKNRQNR